MIEALQDFTSSLPVFLQWFGVMLAAAIPFVESYAGAVIGVLAGLNPVVAIIAAIVGNFVSMVVVVLSAHRVRTRVSAGRGDDLDGDPIEESPRRRRLRERFDRYGVPGVSLLGQTILPSQITSAAMVSFGASKNAVILWQTISIVMWGVAFGVLATLGVSVLR
ncbi:hypothetical protein AVP42_00380 [Agromyces sp. NDB4Y10]|uniref:hypothetical protein n=1 Tax=Agromyces sp. NDB4Y10 TaxID=1775951 RepID=UPI0007B210F9|nr:hypothetical protein [Agromyces sp. NDB4Y10]KZE95404.1 hypothetical protein AVP42_00380 [Agromyces sp. NDB4Y10]